MSTRSGLASASPGSVFLITVGGRAFLRRAVTLSGPAGSHDERPAQRQEEGEKTALALQNLEREESRKLFPVLLPAFNSHAGREVCRPQTQCSDCFVQQQWKCASMNSPEQVLLGNQPAGLQQLSARVACLSGHYGGDTNPFQI